MSEHFIDARIQEIACPDGGAKCPGWYEGPTVSDGYGEARGSQVKCPCNGRGKIAYRKCPCRTAVHIQARYCTDSRILLPEAVPEIATWSNNGGHYWRDARDDQDLAHGPYTTEALAVRAARAARHAEIIYE